jgi:hypothetical protein
MKEFKMEYREEFMKATIHLLDKKLPETMEE